MVPIEDPGPDKNLPKLLWSEGFPSNHFEDVPKKMSSYLFLPEGILPMPSLGTSSDTE